MRVVLSYLAPGECGIIESSLRDIAAKRTDDTWETHGFTNLAGVREYLADEPVLDALNWDLTVPNSLDGLEEVRTGYKQAFLMLLADASTSPMEYIRPNIVPNSLLLKPYSPLELDTVLSEMVAYFEESAEDGRDYSFLIDTRESTRWIPYTKIYYLEARDKKLYIRTRTEEFGFYSSIDAVLAKLPPYFQRCHRSYIANMKKALEINSTDSVIEMGHGIRIPIARSCRKKIKEFTFV